MLRKETRGSASPAHPMRKVEAPLSMTMGAESGKRAKSVSRGARQTDDISPGGGERGVAGGGGDWGGRGLVTWAASSSPQNYVA